MPFVAAGDLKVHYVEAGSGQPVVFVHGNWATCSWWEPTLMRLPPGLGGVAYDMRGRGQTQGPDSDYSIPALAGDLRAFVDALGIDRFHLAGHSLGSAVAMQAALDYPARLQSLTVIAPAWVDGMPEALNTPERQAALKADAELFARALKALAPAAPDDAFWRRLVAEGHAQRLEAALRNLPALLNWRPGDRLQEIAVPKLVISGEQDVLVTEAVAARTAAALGARRVVMRGVGHSPNVEAPDAFVRVLVAHLVGGPDGGAGDMESDDTMTAC